MCYRLLIRVPRVLLAYIIQATGTIVCVLVPFSTWSAFFAGQLEGNGVVLPGTGTATYIATIPYLFYPIAAFVVAFLITVGILPLWGPMKKAVRGAEEKGLLFPERAEVTENIEVNKQAVATEPDDIEIQENVESNNQTFATENKDKRNLGILIMQKRHCQSLQSHML